MSGFINIKYIKLLVIIIINVITNLNIILLGNSIAIVLFSSKIGFNSSSLIKSKIKLVIKYKINRITNLIKKRN